MHATGITMYFHLRNAYINDIDIFNEIYFIYRCKMYSFEIDKFFDNKEIKA